MKHSLFLRVSIVATLAAFGTAACQKAATDADGNAQVMSALPDLPATLPLEGGGTTRVAYAPGVSDLPDAPALGRARIANDDESYGYADAAYSYSEAIGDSPPDYGFDYDGVEPWAWQGNDDSVMFAEPVDDGYRQYYYRPGATEPYFIRDPYYSYGFAGGLLAVIYAADGGIVPYADYGPRYAYASRYFARGRSLYGASRRGRRQPVIAANWFARSPILFSSRQRWGAGRTHQPAWNAYYQANRPRQANYWRAETIRRQADTRRIGAWRADGFRSAAPPRAIPAAWKNAQWARDDRRYRPASENVREAANRDRGRDQARGDGRADRPDRPDTRRDDGADRSQARQREQAQAQRQQDREQADRPRDRQQAQADRGPGRDQQARRADRAEGGRADRQRDPQQTGRQQADHQQGGPDRAQRAERAERVQRPERVERQERPERPQRVERQERPEHPERIERQERPERRERDPGHADRQRQQQSAQRDQAQQQRQQQQAQQRDQGQQQAQQAQRQAQQQQAQQAQQQQRQAQQQQARKAQRQQQPDQQEQRQQRPRRDRDD